MDKIDQEIKKLELQQANLKAKLQKLNNEKKEKESKQALSKQIIIGRLIQTRMESDIYYTEEIMAILDKSLGRNNDRVLFGLKKKELTNKRQGFIKY